MLRLGSLDLWSLSLKSARFFSGEFANGIESLSYPSEALKLEVGDLIGDRLVFRAATTKTKKTREVKIPSRLKQILKSVELPSQGYLFPGRRKGHLSRQAADLVLRQVCEQLQLKGVSTHSFRRTGITKLHDAGVPLRRIQARTGHVSLGNLALYVDVRQSEVDADGELL